jgi:hypothetical protein
VASPSGSIRTVLEIDEFNAFAEQARQGLSSLAEEEFRKRGRSFERFDAVMYCLDAMEKFAKMPSDKVRQIVFEIAMLGTRGFEINDSARNYRLRSAPGEFSGLQLVSLMYVGFKQFAPDQSVGFDLAKEYAAAKSLFEKRRGRA